MDRRIIRWSLSGALLTSLAVGATAATKPATPARKAEQNPQSTQASPVVPPIDWIYDLNTAHKQSQATGKPMLIVCGGTWCAHCKKLEKEVLGHPAIARYINKTFIAVHLDAKKDAKALEILEVNSVPTTVILNPNADLLGSVVGCIKPRDYALVLKQSVEFQKTLRQGPALALARPKK